MIIKKCTVPGKEFTITEKDLEFYAKMEIISKEDLAKLKSREITDCVGLPTLCPEERQRRRLAWRNERKLYQRRCDLCEKMMISIYHNETKFPVYCQDCWWGDNWEAQEFSRDFDFSRPFFEQFRELMREVPRLSIINKKAENADYNNYSLGNKNCYLTFGMHFNEDLMYSHYGTKNRDCLDCFRISNCELCYENIDCNGCYESKFLQNCKNCSDSMFLKNCFSCNHCFGCVNLRNKEFYFLNKKYLRKEYEKKVVEFIKNYSMENLREKFSDFAKKFPHKFMNGIRNENSTGDYLSNTKNCEICFDSDVCENCKFGSQMDETYFSQDMNCMGYDKSELCYQTIGCAGLFDCKSCDSCWHNANINFSNLCFSSKNLFGCIGLKHAQYCILNKQYTKEEYFKLREKIIVHMKKTPLLNSDGQKTQGVEWGEFFPIELSPFAYNETVAQEYFPLTKEEILAKDWKYREEKQSFKYDGPKYEIPAKIEDVDDEILSKILTCEATGKYYKIQKAELNFYRKMNLPVPRLCPDERHKRRMALRNPRQLFSRECAECKKEIQTTFAPDRPEKVLCEECYLKEVN